MEDLQARHRKEQRELQSRVMQKKKGVSKKTRKGVNAECEQLEADLKQKQDREVSLELNGTTTELEDEEPDHLVEEMDKTPLKESQEFQETSQSAPMQISSATAEDTQQGSTQSRKPNRQKARLARRAAEQEALVAQAAEEASNLPDLREQEQASIAKELERRGLREREIRPDGHCLYSAVADQLSNSGVGLKPKIPITRTAGEEEEPAGYMTVRRAAADYISQHPDDFVPFLEEPLEEYIHKIRDTAEWGGQLELLALSKVYGVEINVLQADGRVERIESGSGSDADGRQIWLVYYRHHFGLGEHYNSLRKGA